MMKDKTIFGLRFGSNEELSPARAELEVFLKSPKKEDGRYLHGNDLSTYRELLEEVNAFEQHRQHDAAPQDFQKQMFYDALGHSGFVSPVLLSEVEQYKFHLHTLQMLDFKKPTAFIRAVEEEISRLNPKKRDEAVKLARLRTMADERKKMLDILKRRRVALVRELGDIALYLRDNLMMIAKRCETSIVILVDLQISRKKEKQLIEEIKTHFKEQIRDSLHEGPVTKQYVETVKKEVAQLSKEISSVIRDDVFALTRLYEAVYDHSKKTVHEIDALMAKTDRGRNNSIADDRELFAKIEKVLVSLITDYRFEMIPTIIHSETAHENILLKKRKELLDHIFELLQKERRSRLDRRSAEERRKFTRPNNTGPEQRSGKNRRSVKKRR
jgi:hypothetical protein